MQLSASPNFSSWPRRSTKDLPGGPYQLPHRAVVARAFAQIFVQAAAQQADLGPLAGVLARLRHVPLMLKVPELLKEVVVFDEGLYQRVEVGGKQAGQRVGLSGSVQQLPLGLSDRFAASWSVVCLREVEDVGLVVQNESRAPFVVPIHIIDPVTFNRRQLDV